jgi:DNA-binding response OmpR family regulator
LRPALILLDINLPGVNGLNICRIVRSDEKLRDVKILCISGYNVEERRREVLEAGGNDFLSKPFGPKELSERLAALLPFPAGGKRGGA